MYLPKAFAVENRSELLAHAHAHPFATVTSALEGDLAVSHLPLLIDLERNVLRGHLARQNPQFLHFAKGASVVAVFHGPHGYVSPSVYREPGVPTWNYVVVHVRGRARLLDAEGLIVVLNDAVARFDSSGWQMNTHDPIIRTKLDAIAGFEVDIEVVEGKWKLSQNRTPSERASVADWLDQGDDASRATAALMRVQT